jgi:cell division septation protein DedD
LPSRGTRPQPPHEREREGRDEYLEELDLKRQPEQRSGRDSVAALPARSPRAATANAPTKRAAITESIVSLRDLVTATGSTASASAPANAAREPANVRSRSYSATTESVPPTASGSSSAKGPKPRSLVLASCSHRSSGGLSIASRAEGSKAPTRNACHDVPMLRTAAS